MRQHDVMRMAKDGIVPRGLKGFALMDSPTLALAIDIQTKFAHVDYPTLMTTGKGLGPMDAFFSSGNDECIFCKGGFKNDPNADARALIGMVCHACGFICGKNAGCPSSSWNTGPGN